MGPLNAHTVEVHVLDDRFKGHPETSAEPHSFHISPVIPSAK